MNVVFPGSEENQLEDQLDSDWRLPAIVASKMIQEPACVKQSEPRAQLPPKLAKQLVSIPPVSVFSPQIKHNV